MTSLPELPPELQRLIRERAHRKTSLAEAEVLTGRAIATETRRTPVDDVRASDVKGRRPTVEFAEDSLFCDEPDVDSRPLSYSGLHTDDPYSRPVGSIAEPSFHSRPGTGSGTLTGHSYSPFRDAGPDEISWIGRYRIRCRPPRAPRRPLSTWGNHNYPICSSSLSYLPPSCANSPPNPFSIAPCHLLSRSRDTERSESSAGLSWKQAVTSASEAGYRPDAGLTSSSLNGALRGSTSKSGHPLLRACSAHHPHRSTTSKYHATDRGPSITRGPSFDRQAARSIAALDKLCSSITICSMVGEDRPAASPKVGSMKKLKSVSSSRKYQQEVKKLDRDRRSVLLNTEGEDAVQNEEVSVKGGTNGTFTDGTVPVGPGKDAADASVNGTVTVNDGTNRTRNGTVSVNGGTDATTSGTILTPNGTVSFNAGTDATTNGTILFNDETKTTPSDKNSLHRS